MGRLIDATTFADLETRRFTLRVSATRRDTNASRKDTKMQQGPELPGLGKGASSVKSERESLDGHARIRAEIDQQPKLALRHGKATCLPWRIFYQLYASQIDAATNNVAFSCGFVRFSCLTTLPRPEG